MSDVKPGDRVWMGPVEVVSEGWLQRERVFCVPSTAIPDHPALPAVATYLVDHPNFYGNLWFALTVARDAMSDNERNREALSELFDFKKALEPTS